MQAATQRCPPGVYRERYSLADFEVIRVYGEGHNWSICSARCKWSSELVVLQIYTEVGNVSGCMALALGAAHSLTHHPALLPLYAVFRDHLSSGPNGTADGGLPGGGGGGGRSDRVVMVYPGGTAQHPLDAGTTSPASSSSSLAVAAAASATGGSGPPVSERGVVRNLLQPLADLVAVLGAPGLRPSYVCGLDVWLDSPEAQSPGQALFMVPLMCHRRAREAAIEVVPPALPYAAPYVRSNPAAAVQQLDGDELAGKRWLSWSAAALVHTILIGSPPPIKPAARRRKARTSEPSLSAAAAGVPQLPPLSPQGGGSGATNSPRKNLLMALGVSRPGGGMLVASSSHGHGHGLGLGLNAGGVGSNAQSRSSSSVNGSTASASRLLGGGGGGGGGSSSGSGGSSSSSSGGSGLVEPIPLWLSDEAGDWFRRGLALDCGSRAPLDELLRHPWVSRHAVPRSMSANHIMRRESLNSLPRELHPLLLDVVPLGVTRPGREECDNMMAEMAATEAPSVAKPALPWQVMEGPQEQAPVPEPPAPPVPAAAPVERAETPLLERYEVAMEQNEDGTRIVEELRVMSGKPDGAINRAAKALQSAMGRRGDMGTWVMANPRGTTFEEIAKQNQLQRSQGSYTIPGGGRRASTTGPNPVLQLSSGGSPPGGGVMTGAVPPGTPGQRSPGTPGQKSPGSQGVMPSLPFPGGGGGARSQSPAIRASRGLTPLVGKRGGAGK